MRERALCPGSFADRPCHKNHAPVEGATRAAVEEAFRRLQAELGVERLNREEELERIKGAHRAEVEQGEKEARRWNAAASHLSAALRAARREVERRPDGTFGVPASDAAFREKLDALERAAIAAAPGTAPNEAILERARARVAVEAVLQNTVRECKEAQDAWRKRDEEAWEERNKRIAVEEAHRAVLLSARAASDRADAEWNRANTAERERDEARTALARIDVDALRRRVLELEKERDEARAERDEAYRLVYGGHPPSFPDRLHALPAWARAYIGAIETNADPAGTVRSVTELRENCAALALALREAQSERDTAVAEAKANHAKYEGAVAAAPVVVAKEVARTKVAEAERDRAVETLRLTRDGADLLVGAEEAQQAAESSAEALRRALERWGVIRSTDDNDEDRDATGRPYARCRECGRIGWNGKPIQHKKACGIDRALARALESKTRDGKTLYGINLSATPHGPIGKIPGAPPPTEAERRAALSSSPAPAPRIAWQCSGCGWGFAGPWQRKCPACGREDYWTGSVDPAAKMWAPTTSPALAAWYEPDGSTTMLPAEEVTRRRKLAAKVIGAARAVDESAFQHEGFGTWEVPDQDISDLCAALAALDAPAPEASFVDALRRFHAPTCATHAGGECDCVTWIRAAARPGLCSRCGSTRIALDRDGTKFGACSLVPGDDGTGGCPDPMYDYNREQASLSEGSTVEGDAKPPANAGEGTK